MWYNTAQNYDSEEIDKYSIYETFNEYNCDAITVGNKLREKR